MLLLILGASAVIFYATAKITGNHFERIAYSESIKGTDNYAVQYASTIKTIIEGDFTRLRTLASAMEINQDLPVEAQQSFFNDALRDIALNDASYTAVWDSWELRFINKKWDKPYGRISRSFYRHNDDVDLVIDTLNKDGDQTESMYYKLKVNPEEAITDPYLYSYSKKKMDEVLESSIVVPFFLNNEFAGLVGVDIKMAQFKTLIDSLRKDKPYHVILLSFNGDIIVHYDSKIIGKNVAEADTFLTRSHNLIEKIQSGENSSFMIKDQFGKDSIYYTLSSFTIGKTHTPWAVLIRTPLTDARIMVAQSLSVAWQIAFWGLILLTLITLLFAYNLIRPLKRTALIIKKLAAGDVQRIAKIDHQQSDEIGEMALSVNTVIDGLRQVSLFAENIGKGNYEYEFKQLSDQDILGNAINEMRNSLQQARNDEKNRLEEEEQLNWASQGINIFNRILRVDNQNLEKLSYEIIKSLTTYLGAHMGGIYLKSDQSNDIYELISHIGFDKTKYQKKTIESGEGDTGRCILEQETIFMNDIPREYATISSGLGHSVPVSVLIVPLISNLQMVGILEIESLKNIKPYQIAFVEKIAETIASTVATVKTNVRTTQLLDKSQKQAEELEQQEEEMRQNMEEMQATQEEASKLEAELTAAIEAYNELLYITEYDLKGRILDINANYLKIHKARKSQLIGKKHKADLFMDENDQVKHREFWANLLNGQIQESVEYMRSGKEDYWLLERYLPLRDINGSVQIILCVGFDISDQKKIESQIKQIQEGTMPDRLIGKDGIIKSGGPEIDLNLELKTIDLTYLKMVYKKDPQKIYNILKLYHDTLPQQVKELEETNNARDYKKLKTRINNLKTKMSYMGLKAIYEKLRVIERSLSEEKNLNEIGNNLNTIFNQWAEALNELKVLLKIPTE